MLDNLTVLPIAALHLSPALHAHLSTILPPLALATRSKYAVVRFAVAKCFATLCDIVPEQGMKHVIESVVPNLADPLNVNNRRGAIELISRMFRTLRLRRIQPLTLNASLSDIVELLDIKILPYVIFLVVPVLGRMSDPDDEVRLVATNTFATLVKLVPLEVSRYVQLPPSPLLTERSSFTGWSPRSSWFLP